MRPKTLLRMVSSLALVAVAFVGLVHLAAAPAEAIPINCSLYSRPGCTLVGVYVDPEPYGASCCEWECTFGTRLGPCWLA